MLNDALGYARTHYPESLAQLIDLLRIPSISTLPEHKADVDRAARWLAEKLTAIGLENAQAIPTPGHPVVYADWLHAGPAAPTVIIYGHYDVQPADPLDEWLTPAFEPTLVGDDIFCRGATDDKGQLYTHIAAAEAYLKTAGKLPLNLKFLLEGEEELGSAHLREFLHAHRAMLQADAAIISDTHIIDPATPALVVGVRGLAYMEVHMRGSKRDLHSGMYGGVVENPFNALCRVLATLRDERGHITIPGFYDKVHTLTPQERAAINNNPMSAETLLEETGAPRLFGEADFTPMERLGARPSLDVHGIRGGFTGEGQKTVIAAEATAKVSMRLVPNQDPAEIVRLFTAYVTAITPKTMTVTVKKLSAEPGAEVDINAPVIQVAAQAYERGFGRPPVYLREGGSIPVVSMFINDMQTPVVMMGFGLSDDGLHSPNEKFHLPNFYRGIDTSIYFFDLLAQRVAAN
jgi:acetylornithine deacetylase/succinyl-diaminopimelate desuccinylase-like protein